jgi:hypothetical protein
MNAASLPSVGQIFSSGIRFRAEITRNRVEDVIKKAENYRGNPMTFRYYAGRRIAAAIQFRRVV